MINRIDDRVQTEFSMVLVSIMSGIESLDKYAVEAYLPEMGFHYENQEWSVFKAENSELDRRGYLCYSDGDEFSFLSVRTLRKRVRLSRHRRKH